MYSSKIYVIKKIINKNYVILIILHRDKNHYLQVTLFLYKKKLKLILCQEDCFYIYIYIYI